MWLDSLVEEHRIWSDEEIMNLNFSIKYNILILIINICRSKKNIYTHESTIQ